MSDLIKLSRRGSDGVFTTIWETRFLNFLKQLTAGIVVSSTIERAQYPRAQEYENSFYAAVDNALIDHQIDMCR